MITITLDEAGLFEHSNLIDIQTKDTSVERDFEQQESVSLIAGAIFDDNDIDGELECERERIQSYFKNLCKKCNATYPTDLHSRYGMTATDKNTVRLVKSEYKGTLHEFLRNGTFQGKPVLSKDGAARKGHYYVFAMLKSKEGRLNPSNPCPQLQSDFINDSFASNIYVHMVEETLSHLLFFSDMLPSKLDVSFDLPTRIYASTSEESLEAYTQYGYNVSNDRNRVFLTDATLFRTTIERDIASHFEKTIDVKSIKARPIRYEADAEGYEFLYLADAICTYLGYENYYKEDNKYIPTTFNRLQNLTETQYEIHNKLINPGEERWAFFVYDTIDIGYMKAWEHARQGKIYPSLDIAYETYNSKTPLSSLFLKYYLPKIKRFLEKNVSQDELGESVRQLYQSTRKNNINQKKLVFIFENIRDIARQMPFSNPYDQAILFDLYDAGLSAYNHIALSESNKTPSNYEQGAMACLNECKKYEPYISFDRLIRHRCKNTVLLCDEFRFEKARNNAIETCQYAKNVYEAQQQIFGDERNPSSLEYAIACSQLGQVYGFLGDSNATDYFKLAMSLLHHNMPDYYITESYLLHFYLMTNDQKNYENYAREYFGNTMALEEQLDNLIAIGSASSNPLISLKFALYVYLKSIYTFYLDSLTNSLKDKLLNIEDVIARGGDLAKKQINGHPWEISYKYLSLISIALGDTNAAEKYEKKMKKVVIGGWTIGAIIQYGKIEIKQSLDNTADLSEDRRKLLASICRINPELEPLSSDDLPSLITYIYQ